MVKCLPIQYAQTLLELTYCSTHLIMHIKSTKALCTAVLHSDLVAQTNYVRRVLVGRKHKFCGPHEPRGSRVEDHFYTALSSWSLWTVHCMFSANVFFFECHRMFSWTSWSALWRWRSVTDFSGWDAHEARLHRPDDVSGDIWRRNARGVLSLPKPKPTRKPRPWSPWGSSPPRENSHGRAGNRTQDLMISSQRLWPLDHEAGRIRKCKVVYFPCPGHEAMTPLLGITCRWVANFTVPLLCSWERTLLLIE
jgi:hypothetical protein